MPPNFDVFLSHATTDKPLVEELARRLALENLRPWLDKWNLIPGTPWQAEIESALADCVTCAVFIGSDRLGPWHHEEMRQAIRRRVEDREHVFRVIPVLLPGVERPERSKLPGFLTATTWVEFRDTLDDREAFRRLVCGIRGIEPGGQAVVDGRNPYRGLELFDVEHAPLFFGREAMTEWLLDALKRKPSAIENRFLAIVGASGSGKSSLARAGLLAALKDGKLDGSATWPRAICRPGAEPFLSVATALMTLAPESVSALVFDGLRGRKDGERSLHVAARLVLGEPPRAERLVVLVDQFEEVFTLCDDEAERRDFIANLLHASMVAGGRTIVVLTMRADFYPRCASHADLSAALSDHQVLVGPMTEDELRRAIDRPARRAGLEPEPGLVELLVDDIRGRAGALPLLQFALQEVWRRREDYRLTIRTYREIGQIEGALQRKADAVYDSFTPDQQELCRRVFLRLVQPGEGSEDTRRRASLRELLPDDPMQASAVQAIISRLADPESRLLTTGRQQTGSGEGTLEVAHEALIRDWPKLRKWIETDRAGLRTHLRLTDAAREWADAATEDKEAALYNGARLAVASEWAAAHRDELGALEAAFLSASLEQERQEEDNEAEKNRRLAEAEHLRAEEAEGHKREAEAAARRQKKLSQRFLIAAAVSLLLAVGAFWATMLANTATEKAKAQTLIANSRQLAAVSTSERNNRLDRSLLLAVEALRAENTFEARDSLFRALQDRRGLCTFLHIQEGYVTAVAFSPDGKTIAAGYAGGGDGGGVVLWDVAARKRLAEDALRVKEGSVAGVSFSPDGKTVAAGYYGDGGDGGVVLWDVAARKRLAEDALRVKEGSVAGVSFSPDSKILAAGYYGDGGDGGVVLWDAAARNRLADEPLRVKEGYVAGVSFSPDGRTIAAGYYGDGGDGGVVLWDAAARNRLADEPLRVKEGSVAGVSFSPDGKTLAAGYASGDDGGVVLWDAAARNRLADEPLRVKEGSVRGVSFSPDGRTVAAGYYGDFGDGGVVLWDVAARNRLEDETFPVKEGYVTAVSFSPDGKTLAAGYASDGGVALWDVAARNRLADEPFPMKEGHVTGVSFSPDGRTLAAGYYGDGGRGGVALWDVAARNRLADEPFPTKEGHVTGVSFSPDGRTLAAGYYGDGGRGGVALWDVAARNRLADEPLRVNEGYVACVSFSPDGRTVAAGYCGVGDGGVVLWDVAARNRLAEDALRVKEGYVAGVCFSPDGRTVAAGYYGVKEGSVAGVSFSPRGKTVAAGYYGVGGVALWDVAARKRPADEPLRVKEGYVTGVCFSPDGRTVAAGYAVVGGRGGVALWDVAARKRLADEPLRVKEGHVAGVSFSPDGKTLAAGYAVASSRGDVGGVVLWDVAARNRLADDPIPLKERTVNCVSFSPDGKTLAAGYARRGDVGVVVLLDVDPQSWQRIAGRIANRNFTRAEWRQYFPDEPNYRPTFPDLPVPPEVHSQGREDRR